MPELETSSTFLFALPSGFGADAKEEGKEPKRELIRLSSRSRVTSTLHHERRSRLSLPGRGCVASSFWTIVGPGKRDLSVAYRHDGNMEDLFFFF